MSFTGLTRGRRKAISTVRLVHDGGGSSTLYKDSGQPGTSVTFEAGSWLELFASISETVNFIEIFDSTGNTARLGIGAGGSEEDLLQIVPGGNGFISARIDSGTRVSIRPLITPPADSETTINFYD